MRSLEDHLSPQELANLPVTPEGLNSVGPERQQLTRHLQTCAACASLAQAYWNLAGLRTSDTVADCELCPPQSTWLELASGLRSEQSSSLLSHAVGCRKCAVDLKEALELMRPSQSGEAQELMPGLKSSTPGWQQRLASRLAAQSRESRTARPKSGFVEWLRHQSMWLTLPATAAALGFLVFAGFFLWRTIHPSEARLLAESYNEQRTLVLRIPGAEPVAMASITRSGDDTHGLHPTAEWFEVSRRASEHLKKKHPSAYWLQVQGELDLLQQHGNEAYNNFDLAQHLDKDLPNLNLDLAAALFEEGEYKEASNLYLNELNDLRTGKAHSSDPALVHYNLALCWERQNLTPLAIEELRAALAQEHSPAWRAAIQGEIDRLTAHVSQRPMDGDYETALNNVTTNELGHWDDPQVRVQVSNLAEIGLMHHDRWLSDWASLPHTPQSKQADRLLGDAQRAAAGGTAELSLEEARQALQLYKAAHNTPGRLRAMYDETYAYQRLTRTSDCISSAIALEHDVRAEAYAPLLLQTRLNHAICANFEGNYSDAERLLSPVQVQAPLDGLSQVDLHALSMHAALLHNTGRTSAAWQSDVAGLELCAQHPCSATRHYSFLYDMMRDARDLGLRFTAEAVMQSAVEVADGTDAVTRAYAYERLALVAGQAGDFALAQQSFAQAYRLARSGNQAPLAPIYQADWATDQADVLCREGQPKAALDLLQRTAPTMLGSDYVIGRIGFLREQSVVQLQLGQFKEALASAKQAVHEAETAMAPIHSSAARESWTREHTPLYAQLVRSYIALGDPTSALDAWEHFRALAFVPISTGTAAPLQALSVPQSSEILVIAKVDEAYFGWMVGGQPLRILRSSFLGGQAQLLNLVTLFYRLCADPGSSLTEVHAIGSRLFQSLLQPLTGDAAPPRLLLDLDPSLEILPVAALTAPDGRWLGTSTQVSVLTPWWSLNRGASFEHKPIVPDGNVLIVNGFNRSSSEGTEASAVALSFHHAVLLNATGLNPESVLKKLALSDVFHFSGHTTPSSTTSSVSLASPMPDSQALLTADALEDVHLSHTQLAVLAACNTAAVDPDRIEKLPDLRNALLLAGTEDVVASNWDVDDHSTSALMVEFYRRLLSGQVLSQSLQTAQMSVNSVEQWKHPYYWAGFELFTR